jgi:hypothetical protein
MKAFEHFILIRFNVRFTGAVPGREAKLSASQDWLANRIVLFNQFCLPSLKAQTDANFKTLIYFDIRTPEHYLREMRASITEYPNIKLKMCESYGSELVQQDLIEETGGRCNWLVTTRLDNDDGINNRFVEWLHKEIRVGTMEVLNFPMGLIHCDPRIYLSRQESNAFISLSEPYSSFRTVLLSPHKQMNLVAPVRNLTEDPAWIQVIHGANVSNKVRGKRISTASIPSGFETVLELRRRTGSDNPIQIAGENLIVGAVRGVRDMGLDALHSLRRVLRKNRVA